MSLELLTITGYQDNTFNKAISEDPYQLIINPDSLQWSRVLSQNEANQNVENSIPKKGNTNPIVNLKFEIVIDCTGIVDPERTNLIKEIKSLEGQLYLNKDGVYTSNYVKIKWGKEINFFSQLKSCDIKYTLFKPDGSPIRAKVSFVFEKQNSPQKIKKKKKSLFGFLRKL